MTKTTARAERKQDLICDMARKGRKARTLQIPNGDNARKHQKDRSKKNAGLIKNKHIWHKENGLDHKGFVKKDAKLLLDATPAGPNFNNWPPFHGIPNTAMRTTNVSSSEWQDLLHIEGETKKTLRKSNLVGHKCGANQGVNLGISFVTGGSLSNRKKGMSGSLHWSGFVKDKPLLRKKTTSCFQHLLHTNVSRLSFGPPWKGASYCCQTMST